MAVSAFRIDPTTATSQSATVGTDVASPPEVIVTDIDGFPVKGVAVTWSVTGGGGSIVVGNGTTGPDGSSGVTRWTLGGTPGANTVEASVAGLTGSPVLFQATATAVVATDIAAVSSTSQAVPAGTAVPDPPRVRVTGAGGLPAVNVRVTFAVTAGGGYFGAAGNTSVDVFTDANGYAAVSPWNLGTTPGTNTVQATAPNLTLTGEPVSFGATGQNLGATAIAANSIQNQSAQVSTNVGAPPSVVVTNDLGLGVAGVTVHFAVVSGGGSISPASAVTDSNGIASLTSWTMGPTDGGGTYNNAVTATVVGLSGSPVTFQAIGQAAPPPPTPTTIAANSSQSQSATVGTKVPAAPSVLVTGAGATPVPGVTVQFAVTAGGGTILPANGQVVTDVNGIAALTEWRVGPNVGTNNNAVRATVVGLSGSPVTFQASGTTLGSQLRTAGYFDVCYVASVDKLYASGGAGTTTNGADIVRVFDAKTLKHLTDISMGAACKGLVYANGKVYVAQTGAIKVIDTTTDTVSATITVAGTWYRGVYVSSIDRIIWSQALNSGGGTVIQVNPNTDTQATFIASLSQYGLVCYEPTNDHLFFATGGTAAVAVYTSGGTLVTTITGSFSFASGGGWLFATDASPIAVVASGGTNVSAQIIDPSSNTIRATVTIATGLTSVAVLGGAYSPDTQRGYVTFSHFDGTSLTKIAEIDPVNDVLIEVTGGPATYKGVAGYTAPYRTFWLTQESTGGDGPLIAFCTDSKRPAVRSLITASSPNAPHVTVAEGRPFAPGQFVTFRRNAQGSYRVRLEWPAQITALEGLRRELLHQVDDARGERNYVLNPWGRDWSSVSHLPGWVLPELSPTSGSGQSVENQWQGPRDSSGWTTFAAQVNGAHASNVQLINLKNMTPGDIIQPGDVLNVSTGYRHIIQRAVVDGSGNVTVAIATSWGFTLSDLQAINVLRVGTVPDWYVTDTGIVAFGGLSAGAPTASFAVPYYAGMPSLWITLEIYVWVAAGTAFVPSANLNLETTEWGSTTLERTFAGDGNSYNAAPALLGPFLISHLVTVTPGRMAVRARVNLSGAMLVTGYVRRMQATLGPEADIAPAMEVNADHGALFHSSQRALADRGQVPLQYELRAAEDPTKRFQLGGTVDLRHPARGIAASPRLLRITRTVSPEARLAESPDIELDNLPPSLNRRLSSSGVR